MKKILSALLAISMVCSSINVLATASVKTNTSYYNDFEGDVTLGGANSGSDIIINSTTATAEIAATGDAKYGKAVEIISNSATAEADVAVYLGASGYSSELMNLGFDIRPHQNDKNINMRMNLSWLFGGGDTATWGLQLNNEGKIKYSNEGTNASYYGGTKEYAANEWLHVDLKFEFGAEESYIYYYINGEIIGRADINTAERIKTQTLFGFEFNMPDKATGTGLDIDNVSVDYLNGTTFTARGVAGENYVDFILSEPLANDAAVSVNIEKINSNSAAVAVVGTEKINPKLIRAKIASGALVDGEEYRAKLSVPSSAYGSTLASDVCYFVAEVPEENVIFEVDGDNKAPTPIVYLGADQNNPEATGKYASYKDKGGDLGKVLEIKGDDTYEVNVGFALDNATTGKQIKLSYDLYACQQNQAFTQTANRWIMGCNGTDNAGAPAYGIMLNHQTSFALSNNMHHCWSNSGATTKYPGYSANEKYIVEIIYDFVGRTVTTDIKGVTAEYLPLSGTMHTEILKSNSIKSICFSVNNGKLPGTNVSTGATPGDAVFYVDNIKISDISDRVITESVRLVDIDGKEVLPENTIKPEISGFKVSFNGNVSASDFAEGTVTLKCGENDVPFTGSYENGVYTANITSGALNGESNYTLTVSNVAENNYTYSFVTTKGSIKINTFTAKRDASGIKVTVNIVNTTGKSPAVLYSRYAGYIMEDVAYDDTTIPAVGVYNGVITLPITGTVDDTDTMRVFLWDGMDTICPLTGDIAVE